MNKTFGELRAAFEGMNLVAGTTVAVLDAKTKRYIKATVLSEVPTGDYEIAKFNLVSKLDKKTSAKFVCDISAIHDASIIGQLAK